MNESLKSCLDRINDDMQRAAYEGCLSGAPFARYTSRAADVFGGIAMLVRVIQVSQLARTGGTEQEAENALAPVEESVLLSLIRAVSEVMEDKVESLANWATQSMAEREKGHE